MDQIRNVRIPGHRNSGVWTRPDIDFDIRLEIRSIPNKMSPMQDSTLWAHRLVLSTVSPFLKALLEDFERRGEDVITIFLPDIKVRMSPNLSS